MYVSARLTIKTYIHIFRLNFLRQRRVNKNKSLKSLSLREPVSFKRIVTVRVESSLRIEVFIFIYLPTLKSLKYNSF